jgi:hypothetical protein
MKMKKRLDSIKIIIKKLGLNMNNFIVRVNSHNMIEDNSFMRINTLIMMIKKLLT